MESFDPKKVSSLKEVIKILKTGIELIQSKQQRYLNHANIFISTLQANVALSPSIFIAYLKQVLICSGV